MMNDISSSVDVDVALLSPTSGGRPAASAKATASGTSASATVNPQRNLETIRNHRKNDEKR